MQQFKILKTHKLVVYDRLKNLNDFYKATLKNRNAGNKMKAEEEAKIGFYILQQMAGLHIENPVFIQYYWYEQNQKRDLDNISSFGRKCIQDSLVRTGVLKNDGWRDIVGFTDLFFVDKNNPRIEIYINEISKEE